MQAIAASRDERYVEGNVWLVLLLSDAYIAPEDMVHSTDDIRAGWWVVKAKYYTLVQRNPRGYQLLPQERILVVNNLIRLPTPVQFEPLLPVRRGPRREAAAPVATSASANPLRLLGDSKYFAIEGSMQQV